MIKLRPHHVLCNYCFIGSGYSDEFVINFTKINADIINNNQPFKVVNNLDSICDKCPSNLGNKCKTQAKVTDLDYKHSQVLKLQNGDILNWKQSIDKIKAYVTPDKFNDICKTCEWFNLGICYNQLFNK